MTDQDGEYHVLSVDVSDQEAHNLESQGLCLNPRQLYNDLGERLRYWRWIDVSWTYASESSDSSSIPKKAEGSAADPEYPITKRGLFRLFHTSSFA